MSINYKVETRKDGSKYVTRLNTENELQALLIYRGYNIGRGFTKRLTANGKTIKKFKGY
jgi:hypothetical protein